MQSPNEVAATSAAQLRDFQVAREQAQAARQQAQAQREAAQQAREAARDQARDAREGVQGGDGDRVITITTGDKTVTLTNPSAEALAQLGFPVQVDRSNPDPGPYIIGGMAIIASAIILIVALTFRHKAKMRGASAALPSDLAQRFARMEAGIESVAVEVERISEGQRFTTRLLSDRERVEVPRG